ncbi:MAG TPA: LamG domain-containing protein, partial [Chitinophagales bacterium]|nr:LamG domain-containing protein [Chitinophagales bacterium]
MKKIFTQAVVFAALLCCYATTFAQAPTPELLFYRFEETGTTVTNLATNPPTGTSTATIMGSLTQGDGGQCGGALIGTGNSSSTDYLNTGWATNLTGTDWTISMYTKDITASSTLFYIFGDAGAGSFRCFTNGVAGANNWILRGTMSDVLVTGGATVAPHVTTFVYSQADGNIKAYLDGALINTVTQTGPTISGAGPFKVMGYASNVGSPAGGKLDEFRIYNRALTAQEVATLTYTVDFTTSTDTACSSFTTAGGDVYTASGVYNDTVSNINGCDSIITYNLTINQPSASTISVTACNYVSPSGNTYTASGIYNDTIPNVSGCDSVITINFTKLQPTASSLTVTACFYYTAPSGANYTSSGVYTDTIPNSVGCDSVITINLTINTTNCGAPAPEVLYYQFNEVGTTVTNRASSPPPGTATAIIQGALTQGGTGLCGGALIGSGNSSTTDYLNTGYATNLSSNASWSISMWTQDITSSSTLFYIFGDGAANGFRCFTNGIAGANNWILRGTGLTDVLVTGGATVAPHMTTFVYDATLGNIKAYLDGTLINTVAQGAFTLSSGGPFKVMGYNSNVGSPAGGKLDEYRLYNRALGSAEILALLDATTYSTLNEVSCDSYTAPSGAVYTASGVITDTILNANGCDSIITINLTINNSSTSTLTAVDCDSYTSAAGNTYTASGVYTELFTNAVGCDSTLTINLTINNSTASTLNVTECNSYTSPAGNTYTTSGTYTDMLTNAAGCDSTITINLTINNSTTSTL